MAGKQLVLIPLIMTLWFAQALAGPYSGLIVFGDSLSDTGNDLIASRGAIPASPYHQGRFSNGPTYVDELAHNLGLPSTPSLAGGTNTAFGGARTNRQPFSPAFSILNQVQAYVDRIPAADPAALFVVFGGANNLQDVILSAAADPSNAATLTRQGIQQTVGDLSTILDQLTDIGARTIVVPNAPNLGLAPRFNEPGPTVGALARSVTPSFNEAFETMLNAHTGAQLIRVDSFAFFNSVAANPQMFGLTNVTARCYTGDDLTFTGGGSGVRIRLHFCSGMAFIPQAFRTSSLGISSVPRWFRSLRRLFSCSQVSRFCSVHAYATGHGVRHEERCPDSRGESYFCIGRLRGCECTLIND